MERTTVRNSRPYRLLIRTRKGVSAALNYTRKAMGEGRSPALWLLAIAIGLIAGYGAILFRIAIQSVQFLVYGEFPDNLTSAAANLHPVHILGALFIGGIVVSALLYLGEKRFGLNETRALGIADVMEARAVRGGRIDMVPGLLSSLISAVSLGAGGSAGREGPAVHLGATLASGITHLLHLPARAGRIMLACGAAAAVSASFNAPIAGALFAFEVILGHYALRSIAPVAISSVTGALLARIHFGNQPAFTIPSIPDASIIDMIAIVPLGLLAAGVSIALVMGTSTGVRTVSQRAKSLNIPLWALPPIGGILVGSLAIVFPEVLGVGYEATTNAIAGQYAMGALLVLIAAKILAVILTLAFRFGGGVFSPSLYLGAMLGGLYGALVSGMIGPDGAGPAFFAIVGMGAVSGAVLGAPLSTTLIVFELTLSYETSIALLVAVSLATVLSTSVTKGSYFHKQLERHGYDLKKGNARVILQTIRARDIMTPIGAEERSGEMDEPCLYEDDYLGRIMGFLSAEKLDGVIVRQRTGNQEIIGYLSKADAHAAYAEALQRAHEEEHH